MAGAAAALKPPAETDQARLSRNYAPRLAPRRARLAPPPRRSPGLDAAVRVHERAEAVAFQDRDRAGGALAVAAVHDERPLPRQLIDARRQITQRYGDRALDGARPQP